MKLWALFQFWGGLIVSQWQWFSTRLAVVLCTYLALEEGLFSVNEWAIHMQRSNYEDSSTFKLYEDSSSDHAWHARKQTLNFMLILTLPKNIRLPLTCSHLCCQAIWKSADVEMRVLFHWNEFKWRENTSWISFTLMDPSLTQVFLWNCSKA